MKPFSLHFSCLALLSCSLSGLSWGAEALGVEDRIAAVRALEPGSGKVELVERRDGNPPVTVVKMTLNPAAGSNIKVEMRLPDGEAWNGRLVGVGNGGSAGRINPDSIGWAAAGGYAAVTTDMGTAPDASSGIGNREVWKDFGFRATHLMTVEAKRVLAAYYGRGPEFSYFYGGSTGGQQALQEAQRYPEDYDGIIAAIPAHCRAPLHAYFLWNDRILAECPFTKEQEAAVIAAGVEYMAGREIPPAAGKFISDPRCGPEDIGAVIALAMRKDATLTRRHEEALRKLFGGPRHAVTGARIFDGVPFGSSLSASHGHLYLFKWVFGAEKKLDEINFGPDIDAYSAALGPYLNAENENLEPFARRGGKILMISGTADSIVPYHATLDYYERVAERMGGMEKVAAFFRYFLIPGMGHGGGPPSTQASAMLAAVRAWREKGEATEMLRGPRVDGVEVPLFPYPMKTGWEAGSFKAVEGPRRGTGRVDAAFRPVAEE